MNIFVAGSTGFIGRNFSLVASGEGHSIFPLDRSDLMEEKRILAEKINGADAVINLAGSPVLKRWTKKNRAEIRASRAKVAGAISDAIGKCKQPPGVFISVSATGIYNTDGVHDEASDHFSDDFLGDVCREWEAVALSASHCCRVVVPRMGVVLGKEGGALKKMLPFFRAGLGGKIAGGKQMVPWVHIDDVSAALMFLLKNNNCRGIYNLVSPGICSNAALTSAIAKATAMPAVFPLPAFFLSALFGKGASSVLTGNQHVLSRKLTEEGFGFKFGEINEAIRSVITR